MKRSWIIILCIASLLGGRSVAVEDPNKHFTGEPNSAGNEAGDKENGEKTAAEQMNDILSALNSAENALNLGNNSDETSEKDGHKQLQNAANILAQIESSNLPPDQKSALTERAEKHFQAVHNRWEQQVKTKMNNGDIAGAKTDLEKAKKDGLINEVSYTRLAHGIQRAEYGRAIGGNTGAWLGQTINDGLYFASGLTGTPGLPTGGGSSSSGGPSGGSTGSSGSGSAGGSSNGGSQTQAPSQTHSTGSTGGGGTETSTPSGSSTGLSGTGGTTTSGTSGGTATSFSSPTPSLGTPSGSASPVATGTISTSTGKISPSPIFTSGASSPTPRGGGVGTHGGVVPNSANSPSGISGLITTGTNSIPNPSSGAVTGPFGGTTRMLAGLPGGTFSTTTNSGQMGVTGTGTGQANQGITGNNTVGSNRPGDPARKTSPAPTNVFSSREGIKPSPSPTGFSSATGSSTEVGGNETNVAVSTSNKYSNESGSDSGSASSGSPVGARGLASTSPSNRSGGLIELGTIQMRGEEGSASASGEAKGDSPLAQTPQANRGTSGSVVRLFDDKDNPLNNQVTQLAIQSLQTTQSGTTTPVNRNRPSALNNFLVAMSGTPTAGPVTETPARGLAATTPAQARGLMAKAPSTANTFARIATAKPTLTTTGGSTWGLMKAAARGLALTLTGNY